MVEVSSIDPCIDLFPDTPCWYFLNPKQVQQLYAPATSMSVLNDDWNFTFCPVASRTPQSQALLSSKLSTLGSGTTDGNDSLDCLFDREGSDLALSQCFSSVHSPLTLPSPEL